jgi:hypothetical protein
VIRICQRRLPAIFKGARRRRSGVSDVPGAVSYLMPRALVSCLLVLGSCFRSGLTCLAGVTELIAQIGKLITETGRVLVKGSRALSGLRGALAGSLRFARRVSGSSPGFVAEPLENPDAFDQLLARCRIHDSNTARSPRRKGWGATDRAAESERPDRVP